MDRIRLRTGQAGTAASVAVLVLGGVWVAGGLVSDEPAIAKAATGAWLTASGLLAVVVAGAVWFVLWVYDGGAMNK